MIPQCPRDTTLQCAHSDPAMTINKTRRARSHPHRERRKPVKKTSAPASKTPGFIGDVCIVRLVCPINCPSRPVNPPTNTICNRPRGPAGRPRRARLPLSLIVVPLSGRPALEVEHHALALVAGARLLRCWLSSRHSCSSTVAHPGDLFFSRRASISLVTLYVLFPFIRQGSAARRQCRPPVVTPEVAAPTLIESIIRTGTTDPPAVQATTCDSVSSPWLRLFSRPLHDRSRRCPERPLARAPLTCVCCRSVTPSSTHCSAVA